MEIIKTPIPDLIAIKPKVFEDKRGYFFETYNEILFQEKGINIRFIQDNESKSTYGVVRGLHYQIGTHSQSKLVRVISGTVYDIAVDLRKKSPTFGQWHGIELSAENKIQFLIPKGFAHGFSVLSPQAIFCYKCDNVYNPQSERSIHPMDTRLNIDWRLNLSDIILSDKDKINPNFNLSTKIFE